ncbi:unnamed protein product [Mytilus edulis]|uniref:Uncharacterized protein n=1 Tax=Mytilus edulis TaxID=6550 RepID=A0A8S3UFE5_MYTED|nr:unnamed protein product [Mytilus edulis]
MKLPYGYYDAKSIAYFPYLLRGLGWHILRKLNKTLKESRRQFLISVIVSYNEVATRNTKVIRHAEKDWDSLDWNLKYLWKYDQYSVSFNRLVFLLNHPVPSIHGEARLLDPDGTLRRQICDSSYKSKIDNEPTNNFLADTDQNPSLRLMTKSDNVYCINPNDLRLELKCRKNAKETKNEESEILETNLFDDEDYPNFKRMVKRFRNRSSKNNNRKREIKYRISKHSDKGYYSGERYDDSDGDVEFLERKTDC